jgi:hypothetical protein
VPPGDARFPGLCRAISTEPAIDRRVAVRCEQRKVGGGMRYAVPPYVRLSKVRRDSDGHPTDDDDSLETCTHLCIC